MQKTNTCHTTLVNKKKHEFASLIIIEYTLRKNPLVCM